MTDDKGAETDDKAMSARALKEYLGDKLALYAKSSESVWFEAGNVVGSDVQGIYVEGTGKAQPIWATYRGNITNAADCLVIVPTESADGTWHYDYIKRADLYNKFIDQLYFTFTITQSDNQTITVTTDDGVEHTESFSVRYGTKWTASITPASGYKAGTLSAESGMVKGDTGISATAAVSEVLFYDVVNFKVEYWELGDSPDDDIDSAYGYGDGSNYFGDIDSVSKCIRLSFGYLQSAYCVMANYSGSGTINLVCPIYVPDESIRNQIKDKYVSIWFDGYPFIWTRDSSYYLYYPYTLYLVWWDGLDEDSDSKKVEGLYDFLRTKVGQNVTMHIRVGSF